MGFETPAEFLESRAKDHLEYDANDLLCALNTWQTADIGTHLKFYGETQAALQSIESNIWLIPCKQELYLRYEDNKEELSHLNHGHYCGYESDYGHCSAGPDRCARETRLIEDQIRSIPASN